MEEKTRVTETKDILCPKSSVRVCKDCGSFFSVDDEDMIYFVKTYETIPLKCKSCRNKRKSSEKI